MLLIKLKNQQGFSMLEVLITILIVSFGLLALAGLQMYGIQSNRSSYYRGIATAQAYDLLERMRGNRAYALATPSAYTQVPTTAPTVNCQSSACTAAQKADRDLWEWRKNTVDALPLGVVAVEYDAAGTGTAGSGIGNYNVKITWKDDPKSPNTQTFEMRARP